MKRGNTWTTPADAKAEVQRLWDRGRILAADLTGEALFPRDLRLRRPGNRDMLDRFEDVREWIRTLEAGASAGYEIEWTEVDHRQLGRNRVPARLVVGSRQNALRVVGKARQAERFGGLAEATLERFPDLRQWLAKKPLLVLEHADSWERVLAVLEWFRLHPRAGVYVRQIDVRGVDTKFIEAHKGLLIELLDLVLPPEAVDQTAGRRFEERYGLHSKPALVRLRVLDPMHRIAGLSDITTPVSELATLELPVMRIFITENEINGLAFPDTADSAVFFGMGYALDRLADIPWLAAKDIHYWGDIDTHGFAILDRLRASFPAAHSLLMDRETLLEHRSQWVHEPKRTLARLTRLTAPETGVYDDLAANRLGTAVRLEQERVSFDWVRRALLRLG